MKRIGLKEDHIFTLKQEHGEDFFTKSVFSLSLMVKSELANLAKEAKYKRPRNAYCGLGGCYFEHLQKITNR